MAQLKRFISVMKFELVEICMLPLGSLSSAIAVFVSQNYGANNIDRAKEGIRKANLCTLIWSVIVLIFILFEKSIAVAIAGTEEHDVIDNALRCINYALPFYLPLGILLNLRRSMQSFGRKIIPLISSCIELFLKVISAFVLIPKLGNTGDIITEPISWILCFVFIGTMYTLYSKKKMFERNSQKDFSISPESLID